MSGTACSTATAGGYDAGGADFRHNLTLRSGPQGRVSKGGIAADAANRAFLRSRLHPSFETAAEFTPRYSRGDLLRMRLLPGRAPKFAPMGTRVSSRGFVEAGEGRANMCAGVTAVVPSHADRRVAHPRDVASPSCDSADGNLCAGFAVVGPRTRAGTPSAPSSRRFRSGRRPTSSFHSSGRRLESQNFPARTCGRCRRMVRWTSGQTRPIRMRSTICS